MNEQPPLIISREAFNSLSPMDKIAGTVLVQMGRWQIKDEATATE